MPAAQGQASKAAERPWRVVAVRVSDPPSPGQEPLGGLSLEVLQEFLSGVGQVERITCSPFPRRGPVLLVDALIQYADPVAAAAAVAAYHGASLTAGNGCTLSVAIFQAEEVYIDPRDPLAWDVTGGPPMQVPQSQAPPVEHYDPMAGSGQGGIVEQHPEASGRRVVLGHISSIARPDLAPLGGLTVDFLHSVFSASGVVEKIACTATPRTGTPLQFVDAMIQFSRVAEANDAVQRFDGTSLSGDGSNLVQMKFSKHTELRTSGNSERTKVYVSGPGAGAGDYSAPGAFASRPIGVAPTPVGMAPLKRPVSDAVNAAMEHVAKRVRIDGGGNHHAAADGEMRRVVLAHITDLPTPEVHPLGGISVDEVYRAFSPYGVVEKIVCVYYPKSGPPLEYVDAMVQFRVPREAVAALQGLDGSSLGGGSFSRMQCKWSRHPEITKQGESDFHKDYTFGAAGPSPALVRPPASHQPVGATSAPMPVPPPAARGAWVAAAPAPGGGEQPTQVLAAFNLPEELADPDILFNLFSLYGYVEIVKVVYKQPRDTALVQFSEAGFVDLAIDKLQGAMLRGRPMEVRRSRQASIRCTDKDLNSAEKTTRSYSPHDQFWSRKDYPKIWDNAAQPSRTLFVKNIAPQLTEQDIVSIFRQHGAVTDFGFLPCKSTTAQVRFKTAVVQMAEVSEAVVAVALVQQQRFPCGEGSTEEKRLMACFSKKDEMPRNVVRQDGAADPSLHMLAAPGLSSPPLV